MTMQGPIFLSNSAADGPARPPQGLAPAAPAGWRQVWATLHADSRQLLLHESGAPDAYGFARGHDVPARVVELSAFEEVRACAAPPSLSGTDASLWQVTLRSSSSSAAASTARPRSRTSRQAHQKHAHRRSLLSIFPDALSLLPGSQSHTNDKAAPAAAPQQADVDVDMQHTASFSHRLPASWRRASPQLQQELFESAHQASRTLPRSSSSTSASSSPVLEQGTFQHSDTRAAGLKRKTSLANRLTGGMRGAAAAQQPSSSRQRTNSSAYSQGQGQVPLQLLFTTPNGSVDLSGAPPVFSPGASGGATARAVGTASPPSVAGAGAGATRAARARHVKQKSSLSSLKRWSAAGLASLLRPSSANTSPSLPSSSSGTFAGNSHTIGHSPRLGATAEHADEQDAHTFTFCVSTALSSEAWAEALAPLLGKGLEASQSRASSTATSAPHGASPMHAPLPRSGSGSSAGSLQHATSSSSLSLLARIGRSATARKDSIASMLSSHSIRTSSHHHQADASISSNASSIAAPAAVARSRSTTPAPGAEPAQSALLHRRLQLSRNRPASMSDLHLIAQAHAAVPPGSAAAHGVSTSTAPFPVGATSPRINALPGGGAGVPYTRDQTRSFSSSTSYTTSTAYSTQPSPMSYEFASGAAGGMGSGSGMASSPASTAFTLHSDAGMTSPLHTSHSYSQQSYFASAPSSARLARTDSIKSMRSGAGIGAPGLRITAMQTPEVRLSILSTASSPMEVLEDHATGHSPAAGAPLSSLAMMKLRRSASQASALTTDEHGLGLELGTVHEQEPAAQHAPTKMDGKSSAGRFAGNILRMRGSKSSLHSLLADSSPGPSSPSTPSGPFTFRALKRQDSSEGPVLAHSASLTAIDTARRPAGFPGKIRARIPSPLSSPRDQPAGLPSILTQTPTNEVKFERILPPEDLIATLDEIRRLDPHSAAAARDDLASGQSPCLPKASFDGGTPRMHHGRENTPLHGQQGFPRKSLDMLSLAPSEFSSSGHDAPQKRGTPRVRPLSMVERSPLGTISNLPPMERSLPAPPRPAKRINRDDQPAPAPAKIARDGPKAPLISPPASPARTRKPQASPQAPGRGRSGSTSTFDGTPRQSVDDAGDCTVTSFADSSARTSLELGMQRIQLTPERPVLQA